MLFKIVVYLLSHVYSFATLWTVVHQAPRSMGFSRQEYWSGCHCLLQGIFPTQELNLWLLLWLLYCEWILLLLSQWGSFCYLKLVAINWDQNPGLLGLGLKLFSGTCSVKNDLSTWQHWNSKRNEMSLITTFFSYCEEFPLWQNL